MPCSNLLRKTTSTTQIRKHYYKLTVAQILIWDNFNKKINKKLRTAALTLFKLKSLLFHFFESLVFNIRHLTSELHSNEVFCAQIFQEDSGGSQGFEIERDVDAELGLNCWEVQVGRLLVEGSSVPQKP